MGLDREDPLTQSFQDCDFLSPGVWFPRVFTNASKIIMETVETVHNILRGFAKRQEGLCDALHNLVSFLQIL